MQLSGIETSLLSAADVMFAIEQEFSPIQGFFHKIPISWHGNFIFSTNEEVVNIKGIVNKLLTNFKDGSNASNPYSIRAKEAGQDKPVLSG